MTDQLQTAEPFAVVTDEADGFHYVVEAITGQRVAGPYPLKKTANRRARQECEKAGPVESPDTDIQHIDGHGPLTTAQIGELEASLEPREPEEMERAILEEELAEEPELAVELPPVGEQIDVEHLAPTGQAQEEEADEADEPEEDAPHAPAERRPFQLVEPVQITTREDWLIAATVRIRPILQDMAKLELPAVRVTCGWPSRGGTGGKKRTIGECWNPEASTDGHAEVFINPMEADPATVLAILTHELIHACLPKGTGHKAPFVKAAKAVGFDAPVTKLSMPAALLAWLQPLAEAMPAYPHAAIDPRGAEGEKKKQGTRMIKAVCTGSLDGDDCGYTVRLTRKWIDQVGAPHCPLHGVMVCEGLDDAPEGGDED